MVYRLVFSRDWPGISSCVCQHVSFIVRASIFIENCGRSQKRLGFYYFNLYHNQEFMKNELSSSMRVMRRKAKEGMCGFHVRVCVLKFSSFIWLFGNIFEYSFFMYSFENYYNFFLLFRIKKNMKICLLSVNYLKQKGFKKLL